MVFDRLPPRPLHALRRAAGAHTPPPDEAHDPGPALQGGHGAAGAQGDVIPLSPAAAPPEGAACPAVRISLPIAGDSDPAPAAATKAVESAGDVTDVELLIELPPCPAAAAAAAAAPGGAGPESAVRLASTPECVLVFLGGRLDRSPCLPLPPQPGAGAGGGRRVTLYGLGPGRHRVTVVPCGGSGGFDFSRAGHIDVTVAAAATPRPRAGADQAPAAQAEAALGAGGEGTGPQPARGGEDGGEAVAGEGWAEARALVESLVAKVATLRRVGPARFSLSGHFGQGCRAAVVAASRMWWQRHRCCETAVLRSLPRGPALHVQGSPLVACPGRRSHWPREAAAKRWAACGGL